MKNNAVERGEYDKLIGTFTQVSTYTAALASIEVGVREVAWVIHMGEPSPQAHGRTIHVFTNGPL